MILNAKGKEPKSKIFIGDVASTEGVQSLADSPSPRIATNRAESVFAIDRDSDGVSAVVTKNMGVWMWWLGFILAHVRARRVIPGCTNVLIAINKGISHNHCGWLNSMLFQFWIMDRKSFMATTSANKVCRRIEILILSAIFYFYYIVNLILYL